MKAIGDLLKQARIDKHLSLEDINNETKIRPDHLEAMEEGDFQKLPGEVYTKGFIMNYARMVGLDGHEVLEKYHMVKREKEEAAQGTEEISVDEVGATDYSVGESLSAKRPLNLLQREKRRSFRMTPSIKPIFIGIAVLILIGILVFYKQTVDSSASKGEESIMKETVGANPRTRKAGQKDSLDPIEAMEKENLENSRAPETKQKSPVLKVQAKAVVWIGLYVKNSGEIIYEGTLRPHSVQEWTLTKPVRMRVGNAGGLNLFFRGENLGVPGKEGEVKTVDFAPNPD